MNIYIEAANVLKNVYDKKSSVKKSVYQSAFEGKQQLTALVCQTLKYSEILKTVVKKTKLLEKNRILWNNEFLAQVLVYDYMIGPGLYRPGRLKIVLNSHKEAIEAEFDRLLTVYGVNYYNELPCTVTEVLPRYARVNLIKVSVEEVVDHYKLEGWTMLTAPENHNSFIEILKNMEESEFILDYHLPDVLVFHRNADFHKDEFFLQGKIILQDKASCFPAHILSPPEGAVVVDACAAPGNKTSHLASLMRNKGKIYAFDYKGERIAILQKRMQTAGVTCEEAQCMDFLKVKTDSDAFKDVEYVLVDPSCSGSGIVNRLNDVTDDEKSSSKHRLEQLQKLQAQILRHAFSFPNVRRIVYSTCSIHEEENEQVCEEIYEKHKDKFRIVKVMKNWPERGCQGYKKSHRFLRMTPEISLTNGFFVACFERKMDVNLEDEMKNADPADELKEKVFEGEKLQKKRKKDKMKDETEMSETSKAKKKKKLLDQSLSDEENKPVKACKKSKKRHHSEDSNTNASVTKALNEDKISLLDEKVRAGRKKKKKICDKLVNNDEHEEENKALVENIVSDDNRKKCKKRKKNKHSKEQLERDSSEEHAEVKDRQSNDEHTSQVHDVRPDKKRKRKNKSKE